MNEKPDPAQTIDLPSAPADSLDAGLAAGFGRYVGAPRSSLGDMQPVLLREAEGESSLIVKPNSDAMPLKSQSGDRYQLSGEIARGGMGAVLRGRDVDLGRDLAVKVLLEKYANRPEVARRFIEEAQIGGQLQHPGIVPVYDIGRFGDRPFFTMKLVKGLTLAAMLGQRTDTAADRSRLLSIALQVTQTLAYAHAKGVIHRDLKPANIMVGAFGEVQVMDWGLAKVLAEGGIADEERATRAQEQPTDVTVIRTTRSTGSTGSFGTDTEAGSLLGTPAYMPPEQANGDVTLLDRRADVFGLGAILCEILTGKAPYVGRSGEEVRRKAANGDLADANARLDACGADAELIALTRKCLAPEAVDRPKDAQAVAESLTAYLDGVQARLRKAELAEVEARATAIEEVKRRRLTLALAATVLAAVTLGGGGGLWIKSDRDARLSQVTRDVNEALNKATALREQAKAANVGSALLYAQAREQMQRASALVKSGPADAALTAQVTQLQTELDEEEKDRKLLSALDETRMAQLQWVEDMSRPLLELAVPLFRDALQAYGLPAGIGEPAAAAERIRQRPTLVREALLATLDEWIDLSMDPKYKLTEPHLDWLKAVAEATEPADGWTRQFRVVREEEDPGKQREAMEKLAASADVRVLPARALTRLAMRLDPAQAVKLLRRAQAQYPADFWVNASLANNLQFISPPEYAEAVRFQTAAVALRPDNEMAYFALAYAISNNGKVDEAIACYRKAIELDPKMVISYDNLSTIYLSKKDYDAAIAIASKGIELGSRNDRNKAACYMNLGSAQFRKGQVDEAFANLKMAIEITPHEAVIHTNLACYSALSAVGTGEVADTERVRLRMQALDSLRVGLSLYTDRIDNCRIGSYIVPQKQRPSFMQSTKNRLLNLQRDPDLISIRDASAIAKLPVDEREAFTQLWVDVAAVIQRASTLLGETAPQQPRVNQMQMQLMLANALLRSGRAHLDDNDAAAALPELQMGLGIAKREMSPEQLKEYNETLERCLAVLAEQAK